MTRFTSFAQLRAAIKDSDVTLPKDTTAPEGLQGACSSLSNAASHLEALFLQLWGFYDGPRVQREYLFDTKRRWRFDFALPEQNIAIEIEGGLHNGRHTRPAGYADDCSKYNAATMAGWRVIRLTSFHLSLDTIKSLVDWVHSL